jgi:two-component system response regulator RpaA
MDGLAFARVVHRDSKWSGILLLAVTALGGVADYISTWATGFSGRLTKPVEQEELITSIRRVIRWP